MIKTVEVIVFVVLLVFSFFLGVKYSDTIKSNVGWLQNRSDDDVELPDLSNENIEPTIEEKSPEIVESPVENYQQPVEQFYEPAENSESKKSNL